MCGMHQMIHLHEIDIKARTHPHRNLPSDTQIFAQLIVNKHMILQTIPVDPEPCKTSWKVKPEWKIPENCATFLLAIMRRSETQGTRLLGYLEITRNEALNSGEHEAPLSLQLDKVNINGPSLELTASFSVTESLAMYLDNEWDSMLSQAISLDNNLQAVVQCLLQMEEDCGRLVQSDTRNLWIMHERILLLPTNVQRGNLLNKLGNTCLKHWEASHIMNNLNQAVSAYRDAFRDDSASAVYLADLSIALFMRFEQLGGLGDLDESISRQKYALLLASNDYNHARVSAWLNTLGLLLNLRFERFGDIKDLNEGISIQEEALSLTPDGHPDKPARLNNLGIFLQNRFQRLGDLSGLHKAISRQDLNPEKAIFLPDDEPTRLNIFRNSLQYCFQRYGNLSDLNEAISKQEEAVHLAPDNHPDKPKWLNNLGSSLLRRFEGLGNLSDLNEAISNQEKAISLAPDGHPEKPTHLSNLGNSLQWRFSELDDLSDLNKAISTQKHAVHLTPDGHPDKPDQLKNLGNFLQIRFQRLGDLSDLDEAISNQEKAVHLTPDGHSDKPGQLNYLGISLEVRFERLGDINDLNEAVKKMVHSVCLIPDGHLDKPAWLNNLGISLLRCFESLGNLSDLKEAISKQEEALHLTPDGHPDKPGQLNNLGNCLASRFGGIDNLNQAISKQREAVRLTPNGHPDKSVWLNCLGNSLQKRFQRFGDLTDLNEAISKQEESVHLIPDIHPNKSPWLSGLGNSLNSRFERLGDFSDLNEAISKQEESVHLTPDGHPHKPAQLNNLGSSLLSRFQRLGGLSDLNKAIEKQEKAIDLTPDGHPDKAAQLNNLGCSLFRRFERLGNLNDLNHAISRQNDTVLLTPEGDLNKPCRLNNLGSFLEARFQRLGNLSDLNEAFTTLSDAVCLTPDDHPEKPARLTNLGCCLERRFHKLGDVGDLQEAVKKHNVAACSTTGPAYIRFSAASAWARCAKIALPHSILEPYVVALRLIPELAWLALSINDRHHQIMEVGSFIRDAASAAISSGQIVKGLEWLEQGHSIVWGQLLNLRTPIDALKHRDSKLAEEFIDVSADLQGSVIDHDPSHNTSSRFIKQWAHESALKREKLLEAIRNLEGFEQFLLPKTISQLAPAAKNGPVVFVNVTRTCCDALVLLPGLIPDVKHVPLPEFTSTQANTLTQLLDGLMPHVGRGNIERLQGQREGGSAGVEDDFGHILSELWVRLVKPVLDALGITTPKKDNLSRIWWCPTGPLRSLPIHAAGIYGKDDNFGSKLSDFVTSSYTPSLAALIEGSRPKSQPQEHLQLLAVAQPSAIGQNPIPGTKKEITQIQRCARGKIPVLTLVEHEATIERVEEGMRKFAWVHFACHGVQDRCNPTGSALLLAGSARLTLEKIIQFSLSHADFAFLSACQTATGDKELQEESVHLAAGMLLAGYRGVIATMWAIMDDDAPQVACDVYDHLFQISPPDPTRAAEALHLAIQKLRSREKRSFVDWVPFIHVGV
ncbi:CHAT domain-containing protein [Mycena galopus ATCC 62051]|nr:CHAT domain-containing protein [Mycena galopus ATCC 62051]